MSHRPGHSIPRPKSIGIVNKTVKLSNAGVKSTRSNQTRMYRTGAQRDNQGNPCSASKY